MNANTVVAIAVVAVERAVAAILHTTAGISLQRRLLWWQTSRGSQMVVATVILTALVPRRLIHYNEHGIVKNGTAKKSRRNGGYSDNSNKQSRSDSRHTLSPTHSTLSPASPASTPNISQSRRSRNQAPPPDLPKSQALIAETDKPGTDRSKSNIRRGLEALILSETPGLPANQQCQRWPLRTMWSLQIFPIEAVPWGRGSGSSETETAEPEPTQR